MKNWSRRFLHFLKVRFMFFGSRIQSIRFQLNPRPPWCFSCYELSKKASLIKIEAKKFFSIKFLALISRKRRMMAAYNLLQKCLKFCLEFNERQNKCLTGKINPFSKSIPVPLMDFLAPDLTVRNKISTNPLKNRPFQGIYHPLTKTSKRYLPVKVGTPSISANLFSLL